LNPKRHNLLRIALPLAVWLGVWQCAAFFVDLELLLPSPVQVLRALVGLAGTLPFWQSAVASLARIFGGMLLGTGLGAVLALLTARFSWADAVFSPAIRVIRATPVASFILLVLLWVNTNLVPLLIAGLMVLPVVWSGVRGGLAAADPKLLEAARAYGFSPWKTFLLVRLPSALPEFLRACRTALGLAWKSGVAAEVLCQPRRAIGAQIYYTKYYFETAQLFAWTLTVILLSLVLDYLFGRAVSALERRAGL